MKARRIQNFIPASLIVALAAIELLSAIVLAPAQGVGSPLTRSITITIKEVTDPDVAVSSDGSWLVFTALGHLFQLPVAGGVAKQLTSGPYYDAAPAISPDGTKVAFISDRKISSQGNLFVFDLASRQIRQVTDEFWVDRPIWSPAGKSLAFLSYQASGPLGNYWFVGPMALKTQVRRVGLADGKTETLTEPGFVHAVAFLADGRPVWSAVESETSGKQATSQLRVLSEKGEMTVALTVEGVVDRIASDPSNPRGLYLRLYKATSPLAGLVPQPEHLAHVTLADGAPRTASRPTGPQSFIQRKLMFGSSLLRMADASKSRSN
jgi:dipeptidyl aminopeptidase/acylaminoacyl peptidase